jgi:hypothetical protein
LYCFAWRERLAAGKKTHFRVYYAMTMAMETAIAMALQRQWQDNHAGHCRQWQRPIPAMAMQYEVISCGRFWLSRNPMCLTHRADM